MATLGAIGPSLSVHYAIGRHFRCGLCHPPIIAPTDTQRQAPFTEHLRFTFHFTPTSCSSANAVESLFAKLTRQRLKRGVFTSVVELQAAINRLIAETTDKPKPFVWSKSADAILAAVTRGTQALEAIHSHVRLSK